MGHARQRRTDIEAYGWLGIEPSIGTGGGPAATPLPTGGVNEPRVVGLIGTAARAGEFMTDTRGLRLPMTWQENTAAVQTDSVAHDGRILSKVIRQETAAENCMTTRNSLGN